MQYCSMRIVRQAEQELVVEDSTLRWAAFFFALSLPLFYLVTLGKQAAYFGAILFLGCGATALRKTVFTFDAGTQTARWKRRRGFTAEKGTIPFIEITGVELEQSSGAGDGRARQLILLTQEEWIPMALGYVRSAGDYENLREEILGFLKLDGSISAARFAAASGPAVHEASIRSLLRQGRRIEAVKQMRSNSDLGLREAMRRVDAIAERMKAEKRYPQHQ